MTARAPGRRVGRALAWVGAVGAAVVVLAVVGILVWSQVGVMAAEPEPLAAVRADGAIDITDDAGAIMLSPSGAAASGTGLVFVPGAKVEAEAYVARLSELVAEEGMTVVITRPRLNLAFFDLRGLDAFTSLAPGVDTWLVGGHSLGGVRACSLAADADALVLFGAYCGSDVSALTIPVLSIAGEQDGLSTPAKVADAAHLLPGGAEFVEVPGANHASFGDYGVQSGDGTATITDEEMTATVTALVGDLAEALR